MQPPSVLIVGCGYLGMRVGAALAGTGTTVVGTTTREARFEELSGLGLEPALLDLAALATAAVPGLPGLLGARPFRHVVIACAPGRAHDPAVVFRDGPLLLARALRSSPGLQKLVYVSSTGVYPQHAGELVDEASPAEPPGGRHRLIREAEEGLLALARDGTVPAVVLRLGGLYGLGRSPVEWMRRPEMRERIGRGSGEAWMTWVHVEDAAQAVCSALERGRPGEVYLITDDEPVARAAFYREAAAIAGEPALSFPIDPDDRGKRCSNAKAKAELAFALRYPTYREGLRSLE